MTLSGPARFDDLARRVRRALGTVAVRIVAPAHAPPARREPVNPVNALYAELALEHPEVTFVGVDPAQSGEEWRFVLVKSDPTRSGGARPVRANRLRLPGRRKRRLHRWANSIHTNALASLLFAE